MMTTAVVVVLRPFQLLAACTALVIGSVNQFYLAEDSQLWILIGLIMPATLLTISASVHTTLASLYGHDHRGKSLTIRWLVDLLVLVLMAVAIPLLIIREQHIVYQISPPLPFVTVIVVAFGVNMLLFLATTAMLAVEDYVYRTSRIVPQRAYRHKIVHTTYNEAVLGPRPSETPRDLAKALAKGPVYDPYNWNPPA